MIDESWMIDDYKKYLQYLPTPPWRLFQKQIHHYPSQNLIYILINIDHNSVVGGIVTSVTSSQSWSAGCACWVSLRWPRRGRGWGGQRAWRGCRNISSVLLLCPAQTEQWAIIRTRINNKHLNETSRTSDVRLEIRNLRQENIQNHNSCGKG